MSKAQKDRPRLGRGLSSLISISDIPVEAEIAAPPPAAATATQPPQQPQAAVPAGPSEIPIDKITPNPHQPRKTMNEPAVAELAASIRSTGLIQPIIVRRNGEGFQLIAGERRWRAAQMAGLTHIPAIIRDVDSFTQAQMALIENIQREDLNPIDRALGYRSLLTQLGLTQAELAARLGEDRSSIANYLRLLDLAESVREMVRSLKISLGHAKLLAGVNDILEQQRLAELVVSQGLSVRNLERLLQNGDEPAGQRSRPMGVSPHLQDLEKSLSRQLGMRVQLRGGAKGRGRLVVHYASLDQFDELLNRMGVSAE